MSQRITIPSLIRLNWISAALHAAQAVAVLLLSEPGQGVWTVTGNYLTLSPEASPGQLVLVPASHALFQVNLAYLVAAFFAMSALAHVLVATVYRKGYEANLKRGINKVRWIEYAFSASTMMIAIAILSGVYDFGTLLAIFGLTAIMNLMGLVMELYNQGREEVRWLPFGIGSLAGIIPWLVIGSYFWFNAQFGSGQPPTFVYFIYASIFLFFNCFAVNMVLQYKKVGKWRDYLYGERAYIILSLVAKSALAWQVFAGALRP